MFFPVSRERKLRVFKSALFFISKNDPKTNFFYCVLKYIKKDEIIATHLSLILKQL